MAIDVKFLKGTAAQFEAATKVPTTFYFVDGKDLYLGNIKLSNASDLNTTIDGAIKDNADAINALADFLGTLPDGSVETTVIEYLENKIAAEAGDASDAADAAQAAAEAAQAAAEAAQDSADAAQTAAEGAQSTADAAAAAAKAAQDDVDALEALVGTIPADATATTVVGYAAEVAEAKANAVDGTLTAYKTSNDAAVKANTDAIAAINNTETGVLKQAKDYADGLASNYDPAGSAATAQENAEATAKAYTDQQVGTLPTKEGETKYANVVEYVNAKTSGIATDAALGDLEDRVDDVEDAIETITGSGEGSITAAVNAAVTDLVDGAPEALDTLKEIADWIANQDESGVTDVTSLIARVDTLTGADTVAGSVAKAEKDAKAYADGLDEAMDARVQAIETAVGEGGSVETQISTAIDALDSDKDQTAGADGLALHIKLEGGKVTELTGSIAANTYDAYGAATTAKTEVIGAATDTAATDTIKGAKAYADSAVETALTWGTIA